MLLDKDTHYGPFLPAQLISQSGGTDGVPRREVWIASSDPEGCVRAFLIASESEEALRNERDNLAARSARRTSLCDRFDPTEVTVTDGIATFGFKPGRDVMTVNEYTKEHGSVRWDKALPFFYDTLALLREYLRSGEFTCNISLSGSDVMIWHDSDLRDYLRCALPLANPIPPIAESTLPHQLLAVAPEAFEGNPTERSLLFSATLVLLSLLQKNYPWVLPTLPVDKPDEFIAAYRKATSKPPVIDIPGRLRKVIARNLSPDPEERYESIESFGQALYDIMKESNMELIPPPMTGNGDDEPSEPDKDIPTPDPTETDADNPTPRKPKQSSEPRYDDFRSGRRSDEPKSNNIVITRVEGGGFSDVAGLDDIKAEMNRNFISIVRNPELAKTFRVEPPNGLLLWGPPGNGKSFLSRKLAEESGLLYALVNPGDLGSIYVHGTQEMIADLFKRCEDMARKEKTGVLMVLEEFDAIVPVRSAQQSGGTNRSDEVAEFLTRLNNCASKGVYVVATTNRIDAIDPAIMRKGRMDSIIYIDLPDEEVRRKLFELELRDRPHAEIDMTRLVSLTDGFTSGDITYLVKESARKAFEESLANADKAVVPISQAVLESTIREANPSVTSGERHNYEKLRESYARNRRQAPKVGF